MVGQGTGCREGRAGLLCSDVRLGQKFSVKIRRSKIDQGNLGRVMLLGRELGNQIYSVQAVSVYMQERPKPKEDESFLVHHDGSQLSRYQFSVVLKKAAESLGWDTKHFTSRSFLIGAATTAARDSKPVEYIMRKGRWRPNAVKGYVR